MANYSLPLNSARKFASENPGKLLRLAIISGVLLITAVSVFFLSPENMSLVLLLLAGIAGAAILLKWPGLGLILILIGGVSVPDVGPKNINLPMVMVVALVGIWISDMVIRQKKIRLVTSRTLPPLFAFLFVSLLAFGIGQFPWYSFARNAPLDAQVGGLFVFVVSIGAFLVVAHQVTDIKWLKALTWLLIGMGSLHVILRIIPGLGPVNHLIFRSEAIGGVFWAWFPAMAFSQMLINRKLHPVVRIALGLVVLGAFYVSIVQSYKWKSGWMTALAGVAVVVWFYSRRWGILLALIGIIPAFQVISGAIASDSYSVSTRVEAWLILKEIVLVSPILGMGFANYYWYTPLFPIRGFAVRFNSHNNFVDIVAQTGVLGLLCFVWFFIELAILGLRLRDRVPPGFTRAFVYGAGGGLVATAVAGMLGDWVLPFVYNIGFSGVRTGIFAWIFLGGLVALENMYLSDKSGSLKAQPVES